MKNRPFYLNNLTLDCTKWIASEHLSFPELRIEGPSPEFREKAPPLKNGKFRGQKHLEHEPKNVTAS